MSALAGPWTAVLCDSEGYVYASVEDAAEAVPSYDQLIIRIVRGSARPQPVAGEAGLSAMPAEYDVADVAHEMCAYPDYADLGDPGDDLDGDEPGDATARLDQAKAMAEGLNAAGDAPDPMSAQEIATAAQQSSDGAR